MHFFNRKKYVDYSESLYGDDKRISRNNNITEKIAKGSQNLIVSATDNTNVFVRTWVPYVVFVTLNILLAGIGLPGIILAIVFDILVGIYLYKQNIDRDMIIKVIKNIRNGNVKDKVDLRRLHTDNIPLAEAVNSIGEGIEKAVNTSIKDEKLKADLITNVSHDIKTPLTSIINYVGLIKRENIDNPKIRDYVEILDEKSNKLKQLTEDLLEVSKISSGNISIQFVRINFVEFINQTIGECYEKFESKSLQPVFKPEKSDIQIEADPRHLWRVIENLFNNICKYALPGTRVYMDMKIRADENAKNKVILLIKNISANELKVDADDLTERFIRGDESRTTEGSGLGLSIAKNLTLAQGGDFRIKLEGNLFKVIMEFPYADQPAEPLVK
jgi:signal transduction histidine kinase